MSTLKHWQQIKAIFHSAQEYAPADRANFLDRACGDDYSIRQEVESLLTADETNEDFLGKPAYALLILPIGFMVGLCFASPLTWTIYRPVSGDEAT